MIKISKRLESLAKYILPNDIVMDVGCDHALLDIYLVEQGKTNLIYACDVNANALQSGINNIEKYGMEGKVIPVLGYGIEKSRDYGVNTIIISGMGAKNIIDILNSPNLRYIDMLVLQSNNNHKELRTFLYNMGFTIIEEEIIDDAKKSYINIISIRTMNRQTYSEKELEFGPRLIQKSENLDFFLDLRKKYENIYDKNKSEELRTKLSYIDEIIESLK